MASCEKAKSKKATSICRNCSIKKLIFTVFSSTEQPPPYVQEEPIPTHTWPPENFDVTSGDEDSLMSLGSSAANKGGNPTISNNAVLDPTERRGNALAILHTLLHFSSALEPHLIELLCAK